MWKLNFIALKAGEQFYLPPFFRPTFGTDGKPIGTEGQMGGLMMQ
ncbi:hypothetical protein [Roseivirga sp.]|nr:hypothetical protein [Roseivirga sp.]